MAPTTHRNLSGPTTDLGATIPEPGFIRWTNAYLGTELDRAVNFRRLLSKHLTVALSDELQAISAVRQFAQCKLVPAIWTEVHLRHHGVQLQLHLLAQRANRWLDRLAPWGLR